MSARAQTFVIVGAGVAGAKAAETLRAEGFDFRAIRPLASSSPSGCANDASSPA